MVATKGAGFEPIGPIRQSRPAVSILTAARALPAVNWHSGISWRDSVPLVGYRREFCDTSDAADPGEITQPAFYPYWIYVPYVCDWVTDDASFRDDAMSAADAVTPWHVARELWTGETEDENPSLQSVATDESAADAVHPVTALGTLLEAYEDCSQSGGATVHVPTAAIASLLSHGVVKQQGDVYYGPNGSVISPGPGYPTAATGTGPADADDPDAGAGNVWMYVTGPVEYALDPVAVPLTDLEAHFNRRTNRYEITAQRLAIHRFDPECVFAVRAYVPSPSNGEST